MFCKCFSSCRQRLGRQWDPVASLIHTFAAFLLLSYSKILFVSLQLLSYTQLYIPTGGVLDPPRRVYHDPSLEWFGDKHLPFALLAIFVLCIFVLFPALVLLLYPTKPFRSVLGALVEGGLHYMHLLMSSRLLQEWYQWYKGLSLLCRTLPCSSNSASACNV